MRCYLDVVIASGKTIEELDEEYERLKKEAEALDHWIDPDLPDE